MNSKTNKWINILSILLALLSMGELMLTASFLFLITTILSAAGGYVVTISGLIASLISMPISFKIRSFYSEIDIRDRHFDMQNYHRFMLYVSTVVQGFAVIICFYSVTEISRIEHVLWDGITLYSKRISAKKFVDFVQILLQCCGVITYYDWGKVYWLSKRHIFWEDEDINIEIRTEKENSLFNFSSDENIVDASPTQFIAVPFSCCKIHTNKSCTNFNIHHFGTNSINCNGCLHKLTRFIIFILLSELFVFVLIITVTIILLRMMKIEKQEVLSMSNEKSRSLRRRRRRHRSRSWSKFTNSTDSYNYVPKSSQISSKRSDTSSKAQLTPSSHEQIILKQDASKSSIRTFDSHKKHRSLKFKDSSSSKSSADSVKKNKTLIPSKKRS